jgi:hypothetical protein
MKFIGIASTSHVPLRGMADATKAILAQKWETDYATALTKAEQTNHLSVVC